MGVCVPRQALAALPPQKAPVPIAGGWVDPRSGLDKLAEPKIHFTLLEIEPQIVQPVASRYDDRANPAPIRYIRSFLLS